MKYINLIIFCFILSSCHERNSYKITGNVQGIPDSTIIDLWVQDGNLGTRVSSDTILNGKFNFSDSIGSEVLNMDLRMRDWKKYHGFCTLWVGRSDIEVKGSGKYLSAWKVSSHIREQNDENKLLDQTRHYQVLIDSLFQSQIQNNLTKSEDKGLIYKKIDSVSKVQSDKELAYLKDNYNSKISVIHLCTLAQFGDSIQKLIIKEFYQKIDTTFLNTLWGEGIKNYLNKVTPPDAGNKYKNIQASDIQGKSHQLSDYLDKYILLDFWSVGCYPCAMSLPELRKFSSKYQNKLHVIGVNMDTKKKFWVDSSKRDSITWINLSDGKGMFGGASYVYGINGFPTYILINSEGRIEERWMGFEPGIFDKKLSKYLCN